MRDFPKQVTSIHLPDKHIEQGCLAGAARTDDGQNLPGLHDPTNASQDSFHSSLPTHDSRLRFRNLHVEAYVVETEIHLQHHGQQFLHVERRSSETDWGELTIVFPAVRCRNGR